MTYRKTATIEAVQFNAPGDHPQVYADPTSPTGFAIDTLEGKHEVTVTDWIATGVRGEHWPIKAAIFAETYAPVDAPEEAPKADAA